MHAPQEQNKYKHFLEGIATTSPCPRPGSTHGNRLFVLKEVRADYDATVGNIDVCHISKQGYIYKRISYAIYVMQASKHDGYLKYCVLK